jgi:VWFA-related protein
VDEAIRRKFVAMKIALRAFAVLAGLVWAGLLSFSTTGEDPAQKKKADQTIRVQVGMVSLPVVVTTRDGRRVTDLTKEDFEVYEEGKLQDLAGFAATEEPVTVALLLDTSGSTEQKLARIQNESIRFVNLLHPDDSVAVLSFADEVYLMEDFSINRDRNAYGIKETRPGGSTVLYEAVWLGLEEVLKPITERKALVLFTDGVDTRSRNTSRNETLELAKETRATIYGVWFNTERDRTTRNVMGGGSTIPGMPPPIVINPGSRRGMPRGGSYGDYAAGRDYLKNLAENSGGRVFDALSLMDLGPVFEQVARELASQYSIGYYPSNTKKDGKFRKVKVKVKKPDLVARTKKGYYAPGRKQ